MATILSIETSTSVCSVAIHQRGELLSVKEIRVPGAHAEKLMQLVEETLLQAGCSLAELDAMAVSQGPGSYTGLRIGVSTAKGLAFALDKPLIGINTLQALAASSTLQKGEFVVAVLDARRMEVYSQTFGEGLKEESSIDAVVVEEGSFSSVLERGKTFFVGDAVEKVGRVIHHPQAVFLAGEEFEASARNMGSLAYARFCEGNFEDLAYFVPNYLKEFKAIQSTKNPFARYG